MTSTLQPLAAPGPADLELGGLQGAEQPPDHYSLLTTKIPKSHLSLPSQMDTKLFARVPRLSSLPSLSHRYPPAKRLQALTDPQAMLHKVRLWDLGWLSWPGANNSMQLPKEKWQRCWR